MAINKKNEMSVTFSIIPFISLILVALIVTDLTVYQKVSKTFLIFIFDSIMLGTLFLLLAVNFKKERFLDKNPKYFLFFIAYFVYILIQYVVSFLSKEISYDTNYHFANYIFLIIFALFFYLYLNNLDEVKVGLLLLNLFILIIIFVALTEMIPSITNPQNGVFDPKTFFAQFRPRLTFGNTDYFSGFWLIIISLALITPFVFYNNKKKFIENPLSIATGFIALASFFPLMLSQTRAALIGIFVGIVFILIPSIIIMNDKIKKTLKIILIVLFVFLLIVLPVFLLTTNSPVLNALFPRIVSSFANPAFYINDRLNGWSGGLGLFHNHPVFGAGLGTVYAASFKYMSKYFYIYSDSNSFKHSHNEFVEILGEGGIFGIIFFTLLAGFILVSMFKRAYSKKYDFSYRIICLGIATGLISLFIHQIFSLALRMSVTMSAYFFVLGLAVFLISYSKKALIDAEPAVDKKDSGKAAVQKILFFNKSISNKGSLIALVLILFFIITAFILFLPVFRCENNIMRSSDESVKTDADREFYLKKAVSIMPGNPYAWTYKHSFDSEVKLISAFRSPTDENNRMEYYKNIEAVYEEVIYDLDKINSIIPGYQDVWSKYANIYYSKYQFIAERVNKYKEDYLFNDAVNYIQKTLFYLDKSINMNFLNPNNHTEKMYFLKILNNEQQFMETVKDYFTCKIYIDFARGQRVVKEKITISFLDNTKSDVIIKDGNYHFIISMNDLNRVHQTAYNSSDPKALKQNIFDGMKSVLDNLYNKIHLKEVKTTNDEIQSE